MRTLADMKLSDAFGQRHFYTAAIDVNVTDTDVATVTGLPTHYRVVRAWACRATGDPTAAVLALRTAATGGGDAVIAAVALAGCNAAAAIQDLTIALQTLQTAGTLYWRITTPAGVAGTVRLFVEIVDLS